MGDVSVLLSHSLWVGSRTATFVPEAHWRPDRSAIVSSCQVASVNLKDVESLFQPGMVISLAPVQARSTYQQADIWEYDGNLFPVFTHSPNDACGQCSFAFNIPFGHYFLHLAHVLLDYAVPEIEPDFQMCARVSWHAILLLPQVFVASEVNRTLHRNTHRE